MDLTLKKFIDIEKVEREKRDKQIQASSSNSHSAKLDYLSSVLAAGKVFNILALEDFEADKILGTYMNDYEFDTIYARVVHRVKILQYQHDAGENEDALLLSVGFHADDRIKIHEYVNKIRIAIDEASAPLDKKDRVRKILAILAREVDLEKSRTAVIFDLTRALASISREGVEIVKPWDPYLNKILRLVDRRVNDDPKQIGYEETKSIEDFRE